jgi:hypothetical protein
MQSVLKLLEKSGAMIAAAQGAPAAAPSQRTDGHATSAAEAQAAKARERHEEKRVNKRKAEKEARRRSR